MKPKTRYQQKQERRLYLRDKDHRDIILNDTYINSLWMKKDGKDELVWQRYPAKYLIVFLRESTVYGATGNYFTILDINREFAHSIRWSNGAKSKKFIMLDDFMLLETHYSSANPCYVSFDGLNWSKMSTTIDNISYCEKFGNDNSVVVVWINSGAQPIQATFHKYHFEIDEDTKEITMNQNYFTVSFTDYLKGYQYICDTADGMLMLVWHSDPTRVGVYEITESGATLCYMSSETEYYAQIVSNTTKGCRKGSFYAYVWHNSFKQDESYCNNIVVSVSNNKTDWIPTTIFRRITTSGYSTPLYHLLERNGYFYLYVVSDGKLHAWKTDTGSEWIELNILDYVDVKCVTDGSFVSKLYDKVRIKLKATAEMPNDGVPVATIYNMMLDRYTWDMGQKSFNNVLMQDGTFADYDEEYLGLGGWAGDTYLVVYFDNMIFAPSENNMALVQGSYNENNGIEYIMQGDYCVPEEGITYPYWSPYTDYVIDDIVTYGGLWKCLIANKNKAPTEGVYWTKIREGE